MSEGKEPQQWWNKAPPKKVQNSWKPAVGDCLYHHDTSVQHEKCDMPFYKRVIGNVSKYDYNWERFPKELFDPDTYPAHNALTKIIDEEFKRLYKEWAAKEAAKEE